MATGSEPASVVGSRAAAAGTAVLVAACLAVIVVADVRLAGVGRTDLSLFDNGGWVFLLAALASGAVGVTLLVRRPGHPVGWCFAGLGVSIGASGALTAYGVWGLFARPGSLPAAAAAATVSDVLFIVWLVLLGLVCYLTPTGRALTSRFAWCARALVACGAAWLIVGLLSAEPMNAPFEPVAKPWPVVGPGGPVGAVRGVLAVATNALLLVGAASLVVRFRRAVGDERRRLLWMAVAVVPLPVLVVLAFVGSRTDADVLLGVVAAIEVAVLPVAAALAITRYHLYDVERILSRAVAYLLVSAVLAGLYTALVVLVANGVGRAAGRSEIGIALATLALAAAARPVYRAVQDAVDRRFARRRYDAVHTVRRHVAAPDPDTGIERVLQAAVGDPSLAVAYWVEGPAQWVTAEGLPATPAPGALAVHRAGRPIARISFDPDRVDPDLVRAAAREAEPELDNTGLRAAVALQLEEVRASRARIAAAQLDERRRVERALHDGAQQRLLALAAQQQAALLNGAPQRLRDALRAGVAESRAAVRELRELANGLHPSVLTDGGLTAALDDLASRLPARIRIAEPGRRFPPHIEATAWFVACEATANAVKHASAGTVTVQLDAGERHLTLVVDDDGRGGANPDGRGLRGLADRVAAVHGTLQVLDRADGGTTVRAVLPCES